MLGSVAEAAGLVATRDIKIIHALPGAETALPAATSAVGAGVVVGGSEGFDRGAAGAGGAGGGAGGGGGRKAVGESAGDQVPLFR